MKVVFHYSDVELAHSCGPCPTECSETQRLFDGGGSCTLTSSFCEWLRALPSSTTHLHIQLDLEESNALSSVILMQEISCVLAMDGRTATVELGESEFDR